MLLQGYIKIIDYLLLFQPCLLKLFQSVMMLIIQFLNTIFVIISKFSIKLRCCNGCRYLNSACSYIKFILGTFEVDCTGDTLDPMVEGMVKMMGVFANWNAT